MRSMPDSEMDSDAIRLLTEIGFLAAGKADVDRARRIFDALALVRPDRAFPFIGSATALLNTGRAREAAMLLFKAKAGLPAGNESDMVAAFLGLALQLDGRNGESVHVLRHLADAPDHEKSEGWRLARRLLGENHNQ